MKFPPRLAKTSKTRRASSGGAPQPHSSPKVIVPRQISETRNPLLPRSLYLKTTNLSQRESTRSSRFESNAAAASLRLDDHVRIRCLLLSVDRKIVRVGMVLGHVFP